MVQISKEDAKHIAIVVVGYNRLNSIKRLLGSLLEASFQGDSVPLFISIDCSGNTDLYNYVENFEWPYGNKYVRIQKERLGLKEHIYHCGDLTEYFRAIVLLEDDIFAGPTFYSFVKQALEKYEYDERIAQIALYRNEIVGQVGLPFTPSPSTSDVFLIQAVSSWGECWTKSMWIEFRQWLTDFDENNLAMIDMPDAYKRWTKAWTKYYNAYLLDKNKYVLYPYISLTTNFNESGEHVSLSNSSLQVVLQQDDMKYRMESFEKLVRYDIYRNNQEIYQWLNSSPSELMIDIYGYHTFYNHQNQLLSSKKYQLPIINSYAAKLRPIELNVKYNLKGEAIFLYDISNSFTVQKKGNFSKEFIAYYLNRYNAHVLFEYVKEYISIKIKRKFKK